MREYINETNDIVTELLKLIPSSFLMSDKFKSVCQEHGYSHRWYMCSTIVFMKDGNMFVSNKEKTELTLEKVCHDLCKNSNWALYRFISFLIKSYCEHENTKVNLKNLKVLLRSINVSNFSDIDQFDINAPFIDHLITEIVKWEEMKEAVTKLEKDCVSADGETDYSNIGNSCRHLLIQLAQSVYAPGLHGEFTDEGMKIGKAHIVEMLSKYFSHCLSGKNNEEYRTYTNATLKLANMLTHKTHPTKKDMILTASATINLIYIVGIIGNKFNQM